ncbi:sigma-70 family RNA polymerase sigma factor [Phenylobacterium sp.]|uniref:sigma-70 family RNA polymerase sigma factor n=1 Tax=Phenylobacterium sp. TaxID=1871053 RepID=UPI002EDA75DA
MTQPASQAAAHRAAHDDLRAFESELIRLIPHMRAFARSLCKDVTAADDLAQDALASAWKSRDSFRMGTNMKAWTFRILRNQFLSEKRRDWRSLQLDPEVAERTLVAVDSPDATLALDEVRQALAMLPFEQREALIMVGAGGLSYNEAAEAIGAPTGTVKSRVSRARAALQGVLDNGAFRRDGAPAGSAMATILTRLPARRHALASPGLAGELQHSGMTSTRHEGGRLSAGGL